jgi:hypothetical protein
MLGIGRAALADGVVAGFGNTRVLRHVRCQIDGVQMGKMKGRIMHLVLAGRDAAPHGLADRLIAHMQKCP